MSNLSEQTSDLLNTAEIVENKRPIKLSPLPSSNLEWCIFSSENNCLVHTHP